MAKERLILLSDLRGLEQSQWIDDYSEALKKTYDVFVYDSIQLAGIENKDNEQKIHHRFVNGGIDQAVNRLSSLEKQPMNLLGFSIGGTIGWKFALETGLVKRLFCLSSTRLRKEKNKPQSVIKLFYGENDPYNPPQDWFNDLSVNHVLIRNKGHLFYQEFASMMLNELYSDQT